MSVPPFLDKLPRPVLFGLYGSIAGLLAALTVGELLWHFLRPPSGLAVGAAQTPVPAPPSAQLALTISPCVAAYPGGNGTLSVRVARDRFEGPVSVKFTAPAVGLSAADVIVPAGVTGGQATVTVPPTVKPGTYGLTANATATANGLTLSASTAIEMTVHALPVGSPRLTVSASPKVQTYQRGKNTYAVRVGRGNFDGAITVEFNDLPPGVTAPTTTIPAGQIESMGELSADGTAKPGTYKAAVTARAAPDGVTVESQTELGVEVRAAPRVPVDVVLVLDCTGSMQKTVTGIGAALPAFGSELEKGWLDTRFGLVGFQDTTLGQPLKIPRIKGERMTAELAPFRDAVHRLKLGGGGGEGESSLDGLAEAADCPFRVSAVRVLLLVTDGGPKRSDGRMKSAAETVKYLRNKRIDQLHVVALPDHRKAFEPLWEGAKGKYLDLAQANTTGEYAKLLADLGRTVCGALPERPANIPEVSGAAPEPVLPQTQPVKLPALPPSAEPAEPKIEKLAPPTGPEPIVTVTTEKRPTRTWPAVGVWVLTVSICVSAALLVGQMMVLPGGLPSPGAGAAGYGSGWAIGLGFATIAYFALNAIAGGFIGRMAGGSALGFGTGLLVPIVGSRLLREPLPDDEVLSLPPEEPAVPVPVPPLSVQSEEPKPAPMVPVFKPAITAPTKPRDGCPGCGRTIPGEPGLRYCMLCDTTF